MEKIVGLKEFRNNLETYSKEAQKGRAMVIVRRSKPLFRVVPLEEEWETVTDLTHIRKGGVRIEELLSRL